MILLNNSHFLDMSHLVSDTLLKELDEEICKGLALAKDIPMSVGYEHSRGDAHSDLYDHQFKDVKFAIDELTESEKETVKTMSNSEKMRFIKIAKGGYFPWTLCYSLLQGSNWNNKMDPESKIPTDEARDLFPKTLDWCFSLPIFKSIGRVCIFGIDPCQHVTCHRDLAPEKWTLDDELLMVSPRGNKKFYIYDEQEKKKKFIDSKVFIFHDLNYHGVDPSPFFTYSFRIDGMYSDSFRETIGVYRP